MAYYSGSMPFAKSASLALVFHLNALFKRVKLRLLESTAHKQYLQRLLSVPAKMY